MGRQHQRMDRPEVRQVQEGSGEQGKMEKKKEKKTCCTIICGALTTLVVKGSMMMMMMMMMMMNSVGENQSQLPALLPRVWNLMLSKTLSRCRLENMDT